MNRVTLFLLGSSMLLLNCSAAHGQGCATTLSRHFSVYTAISRDGKNIYTSATIQGYATVTPGSECPMNTATHHVGAENKLNNVDHWSYSANACPTCYFSVTDNEQIVGVPGVVYPWTWDGEAICSIVGIFFGSGSSGSIPGCIVPSTETTAVSGTTLTSITQFTQSISDSAADSFGGSSVIESNAAPGQDTCWFQESRVPQATGVTGGTWPVQNNKWGPDLVGWHSASISWYRANDPGDGIAIPYGATLYSAKRREAVLTKPPPPALAVSRA